LLGSEQVDGSRDLHNKRPTRRFDDHVPQWGVTPSRRHAHPIGVSGLTWLSFVPPYRGASLPSRDIAGIDTVHRSIDFSPPKGLPYDPRHLLNGIQSDTDGDDFWQSGFLDRGSFVEVLGGWAKTVVVGRGCLGGIPIGVIVTEMYV
jgi:hypothetical protein